MGSYVEYVGNNGCSEAHCDGTNANYVDDSNKGYCYSSSNKFTVNGWRVGYVNDNGNVALISAGAPECKSKTTSSGNKTFINSANTAALKYCNSDYVDGDCTTTSDAWAMGDKDFYYITKAINGGYGKRLTDGSSTLGDVGGSNLGSKLYCLDTSVSECGKGKSLIDNRGLYWFAAAYAASNTTGLYWSPSADYVDSRSDEIAYGISSVINLSSSVYIVGGSGTYADPYLISK